MNTVRRRAALVALSMLAAAALAGLLRPRRRWTDVVGTPVLESLFPPRFGDWRIDASLPVVLPSPDVQAKLGATYHQVLSRTYVGSAGQRVMLSVAYGGDQSDGTRAHRPEVCYPAQGFQITDDRSVSLQVAGRELRARLLMSRLGPRSEPVTYWLVVGGQVATSVFAQKFVELRYGLRGIVADALLVRVSTIDAELLRGHATHARFVADLAEALPEAARARVFGASSPTVPARGA